MEQSIPDEKLYPLSDEWTPPKLLVRDRQLGVLLENVRKGYIHNYWIYGGRGLGKTLTVRIFRKMVEAGEEGGGEKVFIHSFSSQSLKDEVERFCLRLGYKKRVSESEAEAIVSAITSSGVRDGVTIVFDDVDVLGRFMKPNLSVLLHGLWEELSKSKLRFNIHLVSTHDLEWAQRKLDPPTFSRLFPQPLYFPYYSKEEVVALLKQRLDFIDGIEIDDFAIEEIAEKVKDFGGDFRETLRIVRSVIKKYGKLTIDVLPEEVVSMKVRKYADMIRDLPYKCALLIPAILRVTFERHRKADKNVQYPQDIEGEVFPVSWDEVKHQYRRYCEEYGVVVESDAMLRYWLEQLWKRDWVDTFTLSKKHEYNYSGRRSLFVRLKVPYEEALKAINQINWKEPW